MPVTGSSTRSSIPDNAAITCAEVGDVDAREVDVARLRRIRLARRLRHVDRGDLVAVLHQVLDAGAPDLAAAAGDDDHAISPFLMPRLA